MYALTMIVITLILYIVTTILFIYTDALYWYAYFKGGRNPIILGYTVLLTVLMLYFVFHLCVLFLFNCVCISWHFLAGLFVCITLLYFIRTSFKKPKIRKLIKDEVK